MHSSAAEVRRQTPERLFAALERWSREDVFSKEFVVLPINEAYVVAAAPARDRLTTHHRVCAPRMHWYLAIIVYPDRLLAHLSAQAAVCNVPEAVTATPPADATVVAVEGSGSDTDDYAAGETDGTASSSQPPLLSTPPPPPPPKAEATAATTPPTPSRPPRSVRGEQGGVGANMGAEPAGRPSAIFLLDSLSGGVRPGEFTLLRSYVVGLGPGP
jgi:hypothetical protein